MVQKLDDGRKDAIFGSLCDILTRRFRLDNRVQENLESVCEENEVLVMRRKGNCLPHLAGFQMKA